MMTIVKPCSMLETQEAVLCWDKDWIYQGFGGED